jgi:GTP cyclohydrolase I
LVQTKMKLTTVGVKDIKFPVRIREKSETFQDTVASISLHADIPKRYRETCVSTFIAVLNKHQDDMSVNILKKLLSEVQDELQAEAAHLEMTFPYFIAKKAPVSETSSLMEYTCRFKGSIGKDEDLMLSVSVPVTTLCPCSKEISTGGAHNQRAEVKLNVKFSGFVWLEDLIDLVESAASSQVYSQLKRPDEKYVTELAYENPMFVEDVVRKVSELAKNNNDIYWFSVSVESFESIHKHSAYAYVNSNDI